MSLRPGGHRVGWSVVNAGIRRYCPMLLPADRRWAICLKRALAPRYVGLRGASDESLATMLVIVIGGTRPFGRHHQRPYGVFGVALFAKELALGGLQYSF